MNTNTKLPEREEIEAMLPWFAAGTLSRRDAARVEAALKSDTELSRRFELVREELGETIRLNEDLGAPSSRALKSLFEKIDAEAPRRRPPRSISSAEFPNSSPASRRARWLMPARSRRSRSCCRPA